jgi:hypothetical protein
LLCTLDLGRRSLAPFFLNRPPAAVALEGFGEPREILVRRGVPASQAQLFPFQLGPDLSLGLDNPKKAGLAAFFQGLDGLCQRLSGVEVQDRHPLRFRAGARRPPLFNSEEAMGHFLAPARKHPGSQGKDDKRTQNWSDKNQSKQVNEKAPHISSVAEFRPRGWLAHALDDKTNSQDQAVTILESPRRPCNEEHP